MGPSAAIYSLGAREQNQIQNGTVDLVAVIPMVRSSAHGDHRFSTCLGRIFGKLPRYLNAMRFLDASNRLLPSRSVRLRIVIIDRIIALQLLSGYTHMSHHKVINRHDFERPAFHTRQMLYGNSTPNCPSLRFHEIRKVNESHFIRRINK
ncbi:hypothetical protein D3C74_324450 [compost metagenome]